MIRRPDCVFNIWPFSPMKICPKSIQIVPKIFKYWSKWWNFAKSGHTAVAKLRGKILKLDLVFGKYLNKLCQDFYDLRQIVIVVNGQMLQNHSSNLVTLVSTSARVKYVNFQKDTKVYFGFFSATKVDSSVEDKPPPFDFRVLVCTPKKLKKLAVVVVSQLVEQSLPTPEFRSLNPFIGNVIYYQLQSKLKRPK